MIYSIASCASDTEVGWPVKNRYHVGTENVVQTWVTPINFPCHGVVTHWRYWAGRSAPFRAMVLRNVDSGGTLYDIIGINDIPAGDIEQVVTYLVPVNKRINVRVGDVVGFAWNSPVPKHVNYLQHPDDVDLLLLKQYDMRNPDDLNVNDRINTTVTSSNNPTRAYSIQAVVSGIVIIHIFSLF